jgi:hypothetical protein
MSIFPKLTSSDGIWETYYKLKLQLVFLPRYRPAIACSRSTGNERHKMCRYIERAEKKQ